MVEFIAQLIVVAVLLFVVAKIVPGIEVKSGGSALGAALVLGLVNALVRPLVVFLTLPITLLTLGLFLLVVNALMFMLAAAIVPGFSVKGLVPALLGSLLLSVFSVIVSAVFGI